MAKRAERSPFNNSNSEEFLNDPLDILVVPVVKRDGTQKVTPALNIGFMEPKRYVTYKHLPLLCCPTIGQCDNATIEEWIERATFLEEDLSWLLRLPYQRFWCQVIYDEDLQACLQSYLSRAPRDYDFNPSVQENILVHHKRLRKLVFLTFLRMSTYKESKYHHITNHVFGELIYDSFVFDIPRMMDLCSLYGFSNPQIMSKMIHNLFNTQPNYLEDLEHCVPTLVSAFDKIEERLGLKENLNSCNGSAKQLLEVDSPIIQSLPFFDLLDCSNYITDTCATIYSFLEAYPLACATFHKSDIFLRMPLFYDVLFPVLEREYQQRRKDVKLEKHIDDIAKKLTLSKSFLIRTFRNFVTTSCIHPVLNARCEKLDAYENNESFYLDNYLQLFTEIAREKIFLNDYNQLFPFSTDLEMFNEAGICIDKTSLNYILGGITTPQADRNANSTSAAPGRNASRVETRADSPMTASAYHEEGATAMPPSSNLEEVHIISMVHSILEILPGYGEGFLEKCLEYYNYSTEGVIDALISENLPPSLASIPRDLKRVSEFAAVPEETVLSDRRGIFDHDEFDVFNRQDVAFDRIRKGKCGKTPVQYSVLGADSEFSKLKELTLRYEQEMEEEKERLEELNLYEDEYDDTYDSHPVGLMERQPENELLTIRPFTTPAVLRSLKEARNTNEDNDDEDEDEKPTEIESNENGERKRDEFCVNPEITRQKAEERRQAKYHNQRGRARGYEPATRPNDAKNKERHKGQVGNHNRRKQSDFKRSRGMMPM